MQPKKLLMISTDRTIFQEDSAVRIRMIEHAKNWDELHIIVFTKRKLNFSEINITSNCWIYPTCSKSEWWYTLDAIRLGKFIIDGRNITDITCQDPFLTAMVGVSLKKRYNLSLEIQLHTDIGSPNYAKTVGNKIRKALALSYLPKADSIRVVSNRIRDYLVKTLGIDESKITVRPIVVDIELIQNTPIIKNSDLREKYPRFDKIILMVSRLEKEKNIKMAIQAFGEVLKIMPKAGLIIVGDGSEKSNLKSQISKLELTESVVFKPWANRETLVSYYKTADLFLNTSFFEGYGMTLVEAKAAGCRIVSTDVGMAREIGALIIDYDARDIAKTIISCL